MNNTEDIIYVSFQSALSIGKCVNNPAVFIGPYNAYRYA